MLRAAVIDYGGGNILSALNVLKKMLPSDMQVSVAHDADALIQADYLLLPGQGAFADCMAGLRQSEMLQVLHERVCKNGVPFLGICVGMQIMTQASHEHHYCEGLGWCSGEIKPLADKGDKRDKIKIPQMGWNEIYYDRAHPVFASITQGTDMYFVHSYGLREATEERIAYCDYGGEITAVIGKDNMLGVQFHVEKSHHAGLKIIGNFLRWKP